MSGNDVKGLASIVSEEITKLRDRARSVGEKLRENATGAHDVISYVEDMNDTLHKAVAELKASIGQFTNGPPKDEEKK